MSDLERTTRSLLDALRGLGRDDEADAWSRRFDETGWTRVSGAEVAGIMEALQQGMREDTGSAEPAMAPPPTPKPSDDRALSHTPEPEPKPVPELKTPSTATVESLLADATVPWAPTRLKTASVATTSLPPWAGAFAHYEPFVLSLDPRSPASSLNVVKHVAALLTSRSTQDAIDAARCLFIDEMGYEEDAVEETARLASQKSITRAVRIARHDDFVVTVVESSYAGHFATNYRPLFQIHPHGLLVSYCSKIDRLRVVFQNIGANGRLDYVTLVGPRNGRHPDDNLLVHARRFALLRPLTSDTGSTIEARATEAFTSSPRELAARWPSATLRPPEVGGAPWHISANEQARTFIQLGKPATDRLPWGLEHVLRNRFPIAVAKGAGRLELDGWRVVSTDSLSEQRWSLIARKRSRVATVALDLRYLAPSDEEAAGAADELSFPWLCDVPVPDENGELILDGFPSGLRLKLDHHLDGCESDVEAGEEIVFESDEEDDVDPTSSRLNELVVDTGEEPSADSVPSSEIAGEESSALWRTLPSTCAVDTLWSWLTDRKLGSLAFLLFRLRNAPRTEGELRRAIGRIAGSRQRPWLLAIHKLRAYLMPHADMHPPVSAALQLRTPTPPSWACLQASAELDHDEWIPVAAARHHPAGGLAIPMVKDQKWQLAIRDESAFAVRTTSEESPSKWWVADDLRWFEAGPIDVRWPRLIRRKAQWECDAVRLPGEELRIVASESALAPVPHAQLVAYHIADVPNPHTNTKSDVVPKLLAKRGDELKGGAVWLQVPGTLWPQGASLEPHKLEVAKAKIMGEPRPTVKEHEVHLGPDEHGVVTDIHIEQLPGPLGGTAAWRASIKLRRSLASWIAVLPDGRMTRVEVRAAQDMPFGVDGDTAALFVEDPDIDATSEVRGFLFDGGTGELVDAHGETQVLLIPYAPRFPACPPDGRLRFRMLDGDGIPSDPSAPLLTGRVRAWMAGARGDQGDACSHSERAWAGGYPPYVPALQRGLIAANLEAFPVGPLQWRVALTDRPTEEAKYDPTVLRTGDTSGSERRAVRPLALLSWRCACGTLLGQSHAITNCRACATQVLLRPRELAMAPIGTIQLGAPVLHPWRQPAAAALLGLTDSELQVLLQHHGPVPTRRLMIDAAERPLKNASQRLGLSDDQAVKRDIGRGVRQLHALLEAQAGDDVTSFADELLARLWLTHVPLPPELERLVGAPPGAGVVMAPSILVRYRRLHLALDSRERLSSLGDPQVQLMCWLGIQHAVNALFGPMCSPQDEADGPSVGSLAALLRRVWPSTRPPTLSHTVPGQFRLEGSLREAPDDDTGLFAGLTASEHQRSEDQQTDERPAFEPRNALVGGGGVLWLDHPWRPLNKHDAVSWNERWAFGELVDHHVRRLAVVADACCALEIPPARWAAWSWPAHVPKTLLGRLVLRELWRVLADGRSRPSAILELMTARDAIALPPSWVDAESATHRRLKIALPLEDTGAALVRYCMARVLSGWQSSEVTPEHPLGGRWAPGEDATGNTERVVPTWQSELWKLLPAYEALHEPVEWLSHGTDQALSSDVVRAQLGLDAADVPRAWWSNVDDRAEAVESERPEATDDLAALSLVPPAPESALVMPEVDEVADEGRPDARIYDGTVSAWLGAP